MTQRTERIDEQLRQEIGQALEREVADPRIGFVTVTDVDTSPDLAYSRVWVSVIGTEEQRKDALTALRRAAPFIRRGLGGKLKLRRIPDLDFRMDDTIERGTRVLRLINELEAGREPMAEHGPGETLPTPVRRLPHEGDAAEPAPDPTPATAKAKGASPSRRGDRSRGSKGDARGKGRPDTGRGGRKRGGR